MDVREPPRIVWENPDACEGSSRSEAVLRNAVASARAPSATWVVRIRVEPSSRHTLRAEGQITGEDGAVIARRTLSGVSGDCEGLARAVGVWASLVLDTERARSSDTSSASLPPSPVANGPAAAAAPGDPSKADLAIPSSLENKLPWPAPAADEKPSPEEDVFLRRDDPRTVELGVGTFILVGTGATNPIAGAAPYVVVETGNGIFLRPSLAVGESVAALSSGDPTGALWGAARFDACLRLPGLYTRRHGIQLDTCGGADVGFIHFVSESQGLTTLPFASIGPSLELRGELGGSLAVALRGVAGINAIATIDAIRTALGTGASIETPMWSGRMELTMSWRLR